MQALANTGTSAETLYYSADMDSMSGLALRMMDHSRAQMASLNGRCSIVSNTSPLARHVLLVPSSIASIVAPALSYSPSYSYYFE